MYSPWKIHRGGSMAAARRLLHPKYSNHHFDSV